MSTIFLPRRHWITIASGISLCRSQDLPDFDIPRSATWFDLRRRSPIDESRSPRSTYESGRMMFETPKTSTTRLHLRAMHADYLSDHDRISSIQRGLRAVG